MRELQLRSRLIFRVRTVDEVELIPRTQLLLNRDLTYTEEAALGKEQEEALLFRAMQSDIVGQLISAGSRHCACPPPPRPDRTAPSPRSMQVRADQLSSHLSKGLRTPCTRSMATSRCWPRKPSTRFATQPEAAGHSERKVYHVVGNHFNWGEVEAAALSMSLFAERQIIELRIPGGKPGKEGSEALQRYCSRMPDEVVTIVQLPKMDRTQSSSAWFGALEGSGITIKIDPIDRNRPANLAGAAPGCAEAARRSG